MNGPAIALAASARAWPDALHRFLLDHGGGVVSARVMGPEQAIKETFEVLVIDDVCSFLTPRLIAKIRDGGREVVGVFSPDDGSDAKRRLLECGISDVIEADATPEEFLHRVSTTLAHRATTGQTRSRPRSSAFKVSVIGASTGVGCTEVSIAIADRLSHSSRAILIDLDQQNPGVAQRLGLPLHPNLHTAIDIVHHKPERIDDSFLAIGRLQVVGGVARPDPNRSIPPHEVAALSNDVSSSSDFVISDLGTNHAGLGGNATIVIGEGSPVGLGRLVRALEHVLASHTGVLAVVNRVRPGARMADEIRSELRLAVPEVSSFLIPEDERVRKAGWDGTLLTRGRFAKATTQLATEIERARL